MATKTKRASTKTPAPVTKPSIGPTAKDAEDPGAALFSVAKEIGKVAEELGPLYKIDAIADNLGEVSSSLDSLANATALSVIAQHGTEEDRATAISILKRWFEDFPR